MVAIDLSGQRFERLTVLGRAAHSLGSKTKWQCVCDCGTLVVITTHSLRSGNTRSCGCLFRDVTTTHGHCNTREYRSWENAKKRCYRVNSPHYKRWGGLGVKMCGRWRNSFPSFLEDMGPCPPGMSLDRYPDRAGDYEPQNCRWATPSQQQRNTKRNLMVEFHGETKPLIEWAELLEIPYTRLLYLVRHSGHSLYQIMAANKGEGLRIKRTLNQ